MPGAKPNHARMKNHSKRLKKKKNTFCSLFLSMFGEKLSRQKSCDEETRATMSFFLKLFSFCLLLLQAVHTHSKHSSNNVRLQKIWIILKPFYFFANSAAETRTKTLNGCTRLCAKKHSETSNSNTANGGWQIEKKGGKHGQIYYNISASTTD